MEFSDVVRSRRMVRRYDPELAVPAEALHTILRNATRAPSAGFSQGWDFVVLTEPEQREAFWAATTDPDDEPDAWLEGVSSAPVLILCCADEGSYLRRYAEPDKGWTDMDEARWPAPYWDIDTGMAALLMLLTAVDEGLGGLFFGVPPESHEDVHEAFAIPHDRDIVGVVAIGYPVSAAPGAPGSPSRRPRRPLSEVAHAGRFGTPYGPA
jgi:nitroreductase